MSTDLNFFLGWCDRLNDLDPGTKPSWGIMTPQHMVEHLVGSWRISNGRARVKPTLSAEEIEKRRAFLFSETPYARNIVNPVMGNGLQPLRKASYSDAVIQLRDEMTAFFDYHKTHAEAMEVHPVFGTLDYSRWIVFQKKHMGHHLAQFGIV